MAEFVLQDHPEVSPLSCYFCQSHEGPFVNTLTSDIGGRIILLCAPQEDGRLTGCAGGIVQAIGGLTPAGARKLKEQRDDAVAEKEQVEARLAQAREVVVGAMG